MKNDVMLTHDPTESPVVELCRDMLARAEGGELTSIALVAECKDGGSMTARVGGDTFRLVGLSVALQRSMLEGDEDE